MKNLVRALLCISISLIVLNCTTDETMPVQGKVQFAIAITSSSEDGGRISSQSFPDGAYISLSIETASGNSVYSLEKINLIKLGDGYITAPLALTEGSYRLTDFFVMSAGGEVLYATPKEGSPLAALVTDPLPMNFSVTPNGIVNLNVQVVDADQQSPEDFGYVSFAVEVVGSDFSISLFTGENDNLDYASGTLRLYLGDDLIYTQNLLAKVNRVNFKGDPNATYTLVVEKEGYTLKTKEYVLHDLLDELNGSPLVFMFSPASTFSVLVKVPSQVGLRLATGSDEVYIDWGDGVVEHAMITSGYFTELVHTYGEVGRYYVNITGDLASVTEYEFTWVDYEIVSWQTIETVDITRLTELKMFSLFWRRTPKGINFSNNLRLEYLNISYSDIQNLDISNNKYLKYLDFVGWAYPVPNSESDIANLVEVITLLNRNAVENNLRDGHFVYLGQIDSPVPDDANAMLINLQQNYGWELWPWPHHN